jgi:hypothetical protein
MMVRGTLLTWSATCPMLIICWACSRMWHPPNRNICEPSAYNRACSALYAVWRTCGTELLLRSCRMAATCVIVRPCG